MKSSPGGFPGGARDECGSAKKRSSQVSTARLPGREVGLGWAAPLDGRDFVQVSTIYAAKGLERPVVVLIELERALKERFKAVETERLPYVACSRASHHLVVLLPRPTPPAMQRFFPVHGEQEARANGEEPL
jgi:superfamily I DNA/RNA helicase